MKSKIVSTLFLDGMINIESLKQNNTKIDKKSNKNIFIYHVIYVTRKTLKITIGNAKGYIEDSNGNKYLTLLDESRDTLKKYEENMKQIQKSY